jgi:hypothetical protein
MKGGIIITNIINEIRKIIGDNDYNCVSIHITPDDIWFYIYENEISITYSKDDKEFCVDVDGRDYRFDEEMLEELSKILKIINDNKEEILDLVKL